MEAETWERPTQGGDSGEEAEQVMSEVHLGCPPGLSGPHISYFTFFLPPGIDPTWSRRGNRAVLRNDPVPATAHQLITSDEDGDLVLPRRSGPSSRTLCVTIQHNVTSSIPLVGLQVWLAELVLADFVLHKIFTTAEFDGVVSLELGAGTGLRLVGLVWMEFNLNLSGLVSILLALVAETVFVTDKGDEILKNCTTNINLNSGVFKDRASVYVRELDWKKSWPPSVALCNSAPNRRYSWSLEELEEVHRASVLVAADVIYSDDLTDAFFSTLTKLMSQGSDKVLYLALEKRYNFSLNDLDVVANAYSHFRSFLKNDDESKEYKNISSPCFVSKCIDLLQIPQYVKDYERGHDVELWQIEYMRN